MIDRILESSNYGMFEAMDCSRDVGNIRSLEASFREHGWIGAYPLRVGNDKSGKLKIKTGHRRFHVARKLGIAVKYMVCEDSASVYDLEHATKQWGLEDYLEYYCSERYGRQEYTRVREYRDRTGIGLSNCIAIMAMQDGHLVRRSTAWEFKNGYFRIENDQRHSSVVAGIILHCKQCGISWATINPFVKAVSKVVRVDGFDSGRLKKKISAFNYIVEKQRSVAAYMDVLEKVYNYGDRNKIPLRFLAEHLGQNA